MILNRSVININSLAIFHISIEFWGIVICFIAMAGILFGRTQLHAHKAIKVIMQICCIFLLVNDSLAWAFRGQAGDTAYIMVRLSNFFVFFSNYVYMSLFAVFLWDSISELNEKMPARVFFVFGLSIVGIGLLVFSQFNSLFYVFDENNYYHRSYAYIVTQLIAAFGIIINFSMLIQYRKRVDKPIFYAMLSYFVLPAVATVIMMFFYGLALQNLAIVVSTQLMFAVDLIDVGQRLNLSQKAYLRASHEAKHDSMTGLWNKSSGMSKIQNYIENLGDGDEASLMFIDIDDFKSINDVYGHVIGDYWIKEIASLLIKVFSERDIVCRFGGDEFLVYMNGVVDNEKLKSKIYHFNEHLRMKAVERGQDVHCSIGICRISGGGHTMEEAVELADKALYEAKNGGKNTYVFYNIDKRISDIPEKEHVDLKVSFVLQEKIYHKFMNIFVTVIYLELKDGTYHILKEIEQLQKDMPLDSKYESRIPVFVEKTVADEYKDAVREFVSLRRINEQTEPVKSIHFKNLENKLMVVHTLVNIDDESMDNRGCLIAIQKIDD